MSDWQKRAKAGLKATAQFVEEYGEAMNLKLRWTSELGNRTNGFQSTSNWQERAAKGMEDTAKFIHENRQGLGLPAASALTMSILALANQSMYADDKAEMAALNAATEQQIEMPSTLADNSFLDDAIVTAQSGVSSANGTTNNPMDDDPSEDDGPGVEPS